MNQQTGLNTIANLVEDFKANESKYLSPNYSEADVRKDFIDKFFNAINMIKMLPRKKKVVIELSLLLKCPVEAKTKMVLAGCQ